jgi:hypothetical protein
MITLGAPINETEDLQAIHSIGARAHGLKPMNILISSSPS